MGLEQQLVMSEPGLISIDNDLAVSKRIYQSLGLMFRDDVDNFLPCLTHCQNIKSSKIPMHFSARIINGWDGVDDEEITCWIFYDLLK